MPMHRPCHHTPCPRPAYDGFEADFPWCCWGCAAADAVHRTPRETVHDFRCDVVWQTWQQRNALVEEERDA